MSITTEAMLLENAYVALLRLPYDSETRVKMQSVLCQLRDAIAELENRSQEEVQATCENYANQRPGLH